jgi:hypothetical protein
MIICGDFYQLPPVIKKTRLENTLFSHSNKPCYSQRLGYYGHRTLTSSPFTDNALLPYLFDSYAWNELFTSGMKAIELTEIFRQKEKEFIQLLESMRKGISNPDIRKFLKEHRHKQWPKDGILVRFFIIFLFF